MLSIMGSIFDILTSARPFKKLAFTSTQTKSFPKREGSEKAD